MKVIVIGGTGHIGTFLIPMLVNAGYETIYITRGKRQPYIDDPAWKKAQQVILDRKSEDFVQKVIEMNPDIIVDLINYNIDDTKKIVEAIQKTSCCTHYLYCSSIWAHGRSEVLPVGRESLTKEPACNYGKDKYESEKYLIEKWRKEKFPMTIISPGQISGPGWDIINPWGGIEHRPFQLIADGETILPICLTNGLLVVGIHKEGHKSDPVNFGAFLGYVLDELDQEEIEEEIPIDGNIVTRIGFNSNSNNDNNDAIPEEIETNIYEKNICAETMVSFKTGYKSLYKKWNKKSLNYKF